MDKMMIYGDSISTGTHGEGAYLNALKEALNIKEMENYAIGSSGLSEKTPNSMLKVLREQEGKQEGKNGDLILVWHGSNDWYWGTELTDFCDTIGIAVETIRKRNRSGLVLWATPIFRYEKPDGGEVCGNGFFIKNSAGHTLEEYTQAIRRMGGKLGFPVIEMGISAGIHEMNEEHYLEDHVHPNKFGYQKITRVLEEEIRKYWYYHTGEKQD